MFSSIISPQEVAIVFSLQRSLSGIFFSWIFCPGGLLRFFLCAFCVCEPRGEVIFSVERDVTGSLSHHYPSGIGVPPFLAIFLRLIFLAGKSRAAIWLISKQQVSYFDGKYRAVMALLTFSN
jgi:hypothetical protein